MNEVRQRKAHEYIPVWTTKYLTFQEALTTGINAKSWVDSVIPVIGGKGGGKDLAAQATGSNIKALEEALRIATEFAQLKLSWYSYHVTGFVWWFTRPAMYQRISAKTSDPSSFFLHFMLYTCYNSFCLQLWMDLVQYLSFHTLTPDFFHTL